MIFIFESLVLILAAILDTGSNPVTSTRPKTKDMGVLWN